MAKMIRLTRDGQAIEVNADQIQWLEHAAGLEYGAA
jgi:hypothetical protein